jgi:hypothetical protein
MYKIKIYSWNPEQDNVSNWRARMQYDEGFENFHIVHYLGETIQPHDDITYNMIIFIRPLLNFHDYIVFLKSHGIKVVVDYDDPFPMMFNEQAPEHIKESINILCTADMITTSTENLKTYFYHHCYKDKIVVLPNVINKKYVSENKNYHHDKVVLGWYGNAGKYHCLSMIKDIIISILNTYSNVYFYLFGNTEKISSLFNHDKVIKFDYVHNFGHFEKSIEDIDINLAPLSDHYFNYHKSNIGIILPGHKKIPSVASNFGPYRNIGRENILLCDTDEDWYKNITSLINDPGQRMIWGTKIKKLVDDNLTYEKWLDKKISIFEKLFQE